MDTIMREIYTTSCTLVFIVLPQSNWDSTPDLFWSTTIFCQPLISNSGWNLFSFSVSGAEQRGGDQGDHKEELGEEPELAWQGDQDPQGAHRVAPRQRRRTPRLQGKPPTCLMCGRTKLRNLLSTTTRPLCLAIFRFCKLARFRSDGTGLYFLQPSLRSPDCSLKSSAVGPAWWKTRPITFLRAGGSAKPRQSLEETRWPLILEQLGPHRRPNQPCSWTQLGWLLPLPHMMLANNPQN